MRRNLLTFIGATDIKTHEKKEYNGAIEQILSKYSFENIYKAVFTQYFEDLEDGF